MASGQRVHPAGVHAHPVPTSSTPRPPEVFVPRPRLDEFLDGVPTTPVSLMVAPAGSGKTTADRKSTRLNSSHTEQSRMPSSA